MDPVDAEYLRYLDIVESDRQDLIMQPAGALRAELSDVLTAAYGRGLLSDHTLTMRLESVLRDRLIDPQVIVGDLYLREPEGSLRDRLSRTMHSVRGRIESLLSEFEPVVPVLLALDWSGASTDLIVGRHPACDITLLEQTVSRHHARLRFRDGRWFITDLGSRNGTKLNGRSVGRSELRAGDDLSLGDLQLRID